jgi:predicted CoA-substrate-specific enzyme activase
MIFAGLDIGSVSTKGILIQDAKIYKQLIPTGWSPRGAGRSLLEDLLAQTGRTQEELQGLVVTGYGRISFDLGGKKATEIKCHARGVASLCPEARLIIDIGGQDSKVINIDEKGRVLDFAMNDKCAAGTGKFLQVIANTMGLDVSELGNLEDPTSAVQISSMCTVFAESEVIGMLAAGNERAGIIAGLHQSVAKRVAAFTRRMGLKREIVFTGGVACNAGVHRALEKELGVPLLRFEDCQYTGALGAALLAREMMDS